MMPAFLYKGNVYVPVTRRRLVTRLSRSNKKHAFRLVRKACFHLSTEDSAFIQRNNIIFLVMVPADEVNL